MLRLGPFQEVHEAPEVEIEPVVTFGIVRFSLPEVGELDVREILMTGVPGLVEVLDGDKPILELAAEHIPGAIAIADVKVLVIEQADEAGFALHFGGKDLPVGLDAGLAGV